MPIPRFTLPMRTWVTTLLSTRLDSLTAASFTNGARLLPILSLWASICSIQTLPLLPERMAVPGVRSAADRATTRRMFRRFCMLRVTATSLSTVVRATSRCILPVPAAPDSRFQPTKACSPLANSRALSSCSALHGTVIRLRSRL